jgi:transcriptional regulator with XRE-family HTH domain
MGEEKDKSALPGSEAVGAYLRLLRDAAGLTLAEIADKVGIDTSQIWRIERGKSDPKASTMFKITDFVGGDLHDVNLLINNPDATREDGEHLARLRKGKGK